MKTTDDRAKFAAEIPKAQLAAQEIAGTLDKSPAKQFDWLTLAIILLKVLAECRKRKTPAQIRLKAKQMAMLGMIPERLELVANDELPADLPPKRRRQLLKQILKAAADSTPERLAELCTEATRTYPEEMSP